MKIEIGKYYRTEDGSKILIHAQKITKDYFSFIGEMVGHKNKNLDFGPHFGCWDPDGNYSTPHLRKLLNLIAEWQDKEVFEGWFALDQSGSREAGLLCFLGPVKERDDLGRCFGARPVPPIKLRYTVRGKVEDVTHEEKQ